MCLCVASQESQPKGSRRPRVADVSKAAGEAWKHLTPQEREKYEVISDKSKVKMTIWVLQKEMNGYSNLNVCIQE